MKKFIYKIKNSSANKIILLIATMIIPINLISLVFLWSNYKGNQQAVKNEISSGLNVAAESLNKELISMKKRLLFEIVDNSNIVELQNRYDSLNKNKRYDCVSETTDFLDKTRSVQNNIDILFYYFPEHMLFLKSGSIKVLVAEYIDEIVSAYDNVENSKNINSIFNLNDVPVLLQMSKYNGIGYGYILQLNTLAQKLNVVSEGDLNRTFFIGNEEGTVVSNRATSFFEEKKISFSGLKKSSNYYLASAAIGDTGLYLYEAVSYSDIDGRIGVPFRLLLLFFAVYIVAAIPIVIYFTRRLIIKPLGKLNQGIKNIENGDTDYRLDENVEGNEFQHIHKNFNKMMNEIRDMRIDMYEVELEKNQIRMDYLSHQIQPHFVLNALNILYSYESDEYELSQKMILCISKYFRHIVYANDKYVTLKSEMEHIENYFEIQRARFPELFYSWVEYDPGLSDALIPPLLIQNFAENAIKHSLKIGNRITIFVIAEKVENDGDRELVRIRLADTGEGISDEILAEIKTFQETGVRQEHLGVGLQNSIERLKMLYGNVSKLSIAKDDNYKGTNVELIIPYVNKGMDETKEQWS